MVEIHPSVLRNQKPVLRLVREAPPLETLYPAVRREAMFWGEVAVLLLVSVVAAFALAALGMVAVDWLARVL